MPDGPIEGELFSRNYLRRAEKQSDSIRARRRVEKAVLLFLDDGRKRKLATIAEMELGVHYYHDYNYQHEEFFQKCELKDFLSTVTLFLNLAPNIEDALEYIRRVFEQEDLQYRIDEKGGVHYLVDEQFENTIQSTLVGLGDKRFVATKDALEAGLKHLGTENQSGKALIRGVFEAVESAYLVVIDDKKQNRLNGQSIAKHLKPILLDQYKGIPDADDKVDRILCSFAEWVKTAHPYRHGAALEEIHEAPIDEAILTASNGMSFIRYLVANAGPS